MRVNMPIRVAAVRLWLPSGYETTDEAVQAGLVDAEAGAKDGYKALTVSDDLSAPEMAVLAVRDALEDAGVSPEQVGLVVHAWLYHQGHDFWSPAHYIAAMSGASRAVALGVQQMCNGGAAALEVALARMLSDPSLSNAVVTTADRFCPPGFDRWCDYGVAYGDGATALVLDRVAGPYEILAVSTACAPGLEAMHRGDDEFSRAPRQHRDTIDIRRNKKIFMSNGGGPRFAHEAKAAVQAAIRGVLAEAGIASDDPSVRYLALPRLGSDLLEQAYIPAVAGLTGAEILDFGRETGHLGAGDAIANLADIHAFHRPRPGEITLLVSAGAGFSWTCVAVRACADDREPTAAA
ncbi:MAG TPA: ketoacyl-ACP synthase III family protein [Micromonosporaceae bacterium]